MPNRFTVVLVTLLVATACTTTKDEPFFYHRDYGVVGGNNDNFRRDAHFCAEHVSQQQGNQQDGQELSPEELNALAAALDIKIVVGLPEAGAVAARILGHLNQVGRCLKANGWALLPTSP